MGYELTIDCVLFRRYSGTYHYEASKSAGMLSTETVGDLIELFRGYIRDLGHKERHEIRLYEVRRLTVVWLNCQRACSQKKHSSSPTKKHLTKLDV